MNVLKFIQYQPSNPNWVIPEKTHTPPTDGTLEILAGGGSKALEILAGGGGLDLKIFFGGHFHLDLLGL